jgi:hypothetical protein
LVLAISNNERHAARYLDYLEAVILGEGEKRVELAGELSESPAGRLFKNVLVVT